VTAILPFCYRPRHRRSVSVALELPVPLPSAGLVGLRFPLCDRLEPHLTHVERALVDAIAVGGAPILFSSVNPFASLSPIWDLRAPGRSVEVR
jgi:hypothetical protein